jgi:folylpolyglutamate synthase
VDSFLRAHGERTGFPLKVGLYTSPPISSLLDTIRINFTPMSEDMFTSCFFDVWEKVSDHTLQKGWPMPGYLQLLTIVSIHIFMNETHSGGEYDATNILFPVVTGITTLGMDHVEALGPTIQDIAWHKGGIMKPGIPSFSSPQTPEPATVLQQRAVEKGVRLEFVESDPALPAAAPALEPFVQKLNASLALSLARSFLEGVADGELTSMDIVRGIEQYNWPGRFQKVFDGRYRWFLDVAHNELSLDIAAKWFADAVNSMPRCV